MSAVRKAGTSSSKRRQQRGDEPNGSYQRDSEEEPPHPASPPLQAVKANPKLAAMAGWSTFYAVADGHEVGIYPTWAQCEQQVKGYSGAVFKKLSTLQEALDFMPDDWKVPLLLEPRPKPKAAAVAATAAAAAPQRQAKTLGKRNAATAVATARQYSAAVGGSGGQGAVDDDAVDGDGGGGTGSGLQPAERAAKLKQLSALLDELCASDAAASAAASALLDHLQHRQLRAAGGAGGARADGGEASGSASGGRGSGGREQADASSAEADDGQLHFEDLDPRVDPELEYRLEFDGGARGNPGPAGFGALLVEVCSGRHVEYVAGSAPHATNNQAEWTALVAGTEVAVALGVRRLVVQGDSELVVHQVLGRKAVRNEGLRPLAERFADLQRRLKQLQAVHVPRALNGRADALSNLAMDAQGHAASLRSAARQLEQAGSKVDVWLLLQEGGVTSAAAGSSQELQAASRDGAIRASRCGSDQATFCEQLLLQACRQDGLL